MSAEIEFVDERELARRLGVAQITLSKWRAAGEGPPWVRLGRRAVRYRWADVLAWIDGDKVVGGASCAP